MYAESMNIDNIDLYRPRMELRSLKSVKLHHKFTKLTKIQKKVRIIVDWSYGTIYPKSSNVLKQKKTLKSLLRDIILNHRNR